MLDATQLQERRRPSRVTAVATALILLAVGWLGARHEAEVAHVREQSGRIVHAQELADHHGADTSAHLHGLELHDHGGGACALLAITHEPVGLASPIASTTPHSHPTPAALRRLATPPAAVAPYRLAPKTSPPTLG